MLRNPGEYDETLAALTPWARQDGIVVTDLSDEMLVYDLETHAAHNLNRTATLVWRHCDGRTTVRGLAAILERELGAPADAEVVLLSLRQLDKARLLREPLPAEADTARYSRRQLLRKTAIRGAILAPVVASIVAPTAAHAASVTCTDGGSPEPPGGCPPNTFSSGGCCYPTS